MASIRTTQGCLLLGALCAVDILVYYVHPEKLSAHGDVRRQQIPNVALQPIDFRGKSEYYTHCEIAEVIATHHKYRRVSLWEKPYGPVLQL